jgi:hypothetical protein
MEKVTEMMDEKTLAVVSVLAAISEYIPKWVNIITIERHVAFVVSVTAGLLAIYKHFKKEKQQP